MSAADQIPTRILDRLKEYHWPGNVRELENVLERAIILSRGSSLCPDGIRLGSARPARTSDRNEGHDGGPLDAGETLDANERVHIIRICEACSWKIKGAGGAAERLGLKPSTLYWRLKKHRIERPRAVR